MRRQSPRVGRWIVLILAVVLIWFLVKPSTITLDQEIVIQEGDTFQSFLSSLSSRERSKFKLYLKRKDIDVNTVSVGSYQFSGTYSFAELIRVIQDGPTQHYLPYTVLEGRSIYDIDYSLAQKDLISVGDYINYVTSATTIDTFQKRYHFLPDSITSLEGFLYPDTYHLDSNQFVVSQLVTLQLQAFTDKIRMKYGEQIDAFTDKLVADGLSLRLTPYGIITLSSVVEKEERNVVNKATVAGVFLRRLSIGMRLDADITLCYGLQQPYSICTPSYIAQNVRDKNNVYNTRQRAGLPPQPIANPSAETVHALLNYELTNYLFYLHAPNGKIYYGETIEQHNKNKQEHLR